MRTHIILAALALGLVVAVGKAQSSHNIVAIMDTPRVTAISTNSGTVTATGEADANIPGDTIRTDWYTAVAALEYAEENGGSAIRGKVKQPTDVLDDFNRADEDPLSGGGNWAQADSSVWENMRISSNKATNHSGGSTSSMSYWTQDTYPGGEGSVWAQWGNINQAGDNRASVLLVAHAGSGDGTGDLDGYEFSRYSDGGTNPSWRMYRIDNAVRTQLGSSSTSNTSYTYFNLRRIGTTVEGWASPDRETWTLIMQQTDSTYTTGTFYPATHGRTAGVTIDDFGIGPVGIVNDEIEEYSNITDYGDTLTEGGADTIMAANASAAEATLVDSTFYEFFDGMVEMVVEPDDVEEFLEDYEARMETLVDDLAFEGKPLLVVVQDAGDNVIIQGHVPVGDGEYVSISWEDLGVNVLISDDENPTPGSSGPGGGAVYVTAETSGDPTVSKGATARPEMLSLDTPTGTAIFTGLRGQHEEEVDGVPVTTMVEFGWIKSDGAIGFDLGADGTETSGPCIEDDDTVEGILVGWIDANGVFECYYTATIPGSVAWGSDSMFAIRNGIPTNGTCSGVTVCGWQFKFTPTGGSASCFYPVGCQSSGQLAVPTHWDEVEFELVTEYIGPAPTTFDVEFGDSGGGGGFYRGFVVQPGTDPTGADDQVSEAQVDVLDDASVWTTHSFTYYGGSDRNYTLINLDG
jgi:hypothetical protein